MFVSLNSMKNILILSILALGAISCGSKKDAAAVSTSNSSNSGSSTSNTAFKEIPQGDYKTDSLLVTLEIGACFGNCPVEKFSIYIDGTFTYEGINNVNHMGDFVGTIKKDEVKEIYTMMSLLKIGEYPGKFGLEVTDISTKSIIFNYQNTRKKIIFKQYLDYGELKGFITRLRGIMADGKYTRVKER